METLNRQSRKRWRPRPATSVRSVMADIAGGGSSEFYRRVAEEAHELGCLEAARRSEESCRLINLDPFERKQVDGKTLVPRPDSNGRLGGMETKLSSD
jgi:hypothetical protein